MSSLKYLVCDMEPATCALACILQDQTENRTAVGAYQGRALGA